MSHYPIYHAKRPCRKCGYTERLKSTGKCWTCEWNAAERYMKWFFANRDQIGRRHKWSAAQRRLHDRSMNVWTLFPVDLRNRESAKGRQGGRRGAAGRYTRFDIERSVRARMVNALTARKRKTCTATTSFPSHGAARTGLGIFSCYARSTTPARTLRPIASIGCCSDYRQRTRSTTPSKRC